MVYATPPYDNDKMLLLQLSNGSDAAFKELYNRHWNKIYALAITYLKSPALAQDIVQDVFLKVWIKRAGLHQVENFDAFVFTIGRNEIISLLRKKSLEVELPATFAEPEGGLPEPDKVLHLKQTQHRLQEAIEQLPQQQRLIFKMSREDGLTHSEIAQRLGLFRETVKNHMVRALNTLRKQLPDTERLLLLACFTHLFFC